MAQRVCKITGSVLAADHESNLARWVSWDGGVCILDIGEDLLAVLLEPGDELKMIPHVLACSKVS